MRSSLLGRSITGRMHLLAADGVRGRLALVTGRCLRIHIAIRTDGFQHPSCIESKLTGGRQMVDNNVSTRLYSKTYTVPGGPGEFDILVRWVRGHSPYPQISDMDVWAYNVHLGRHFFPKAPDDFLAVGHVTITQEARVFVNGADAGVWPEYLPSPPPAPEG